MDCRRFQALLDAGMRVRAREQLMAMTAAAFPQMDEKAQRKAIADLERAAGQTGAGRSASAEPDGDWHKLAAAVMGDRLQHPLTPQALKVLQGKA